MSQTLKAFRSKSGSEDLFMKNVFLCFVFLILGFFASVSAIACTCQSDLLFDEDQENETTEEKVKEEFDTASTIFSGKVLSIKNNRTKSNPAGDGRNLITFEVENTWKNKPAKRVTLSTGRGGADCGYKFEVGKKYLVYAYGEKDLGTSRCSRTRMFSKALEDIEVLDRLKKSLVK